MPRVARIVVPGLPHHITQRGNNQQDVFFVDDDRRAYLSFLKKRAASGGLSILGYCLMTNHVHIVAVPEKEESLAKVLGRTHFLYTQYVNRLHGRSGHLWQNRFYSCLMDEPHLWNALQYVECNPVRAGIVRMPWRYRWSSASAHTGEPDRSGLLDLSEWADAWTPARWKRALRGAVDEHETSRIRQSTRTGRPLATDQFVSKLECVLGRRIRPLPVGRPRKKKGKRVASQKGK